MALTGSSNADSNASKVLYVGLECFNVITLNPNKEEMKDILGISVEDEPVYTKTNDEGVTSTRLDFWLDNGKEGDAHIRTKLTYFVSNVKRENSTKDKVQIINQYASTLWLTKEDFESNTIPDYAKDWYSTEGIRRAYEGEDRLMEFLANFLNISVKKGDTCTLDNLEDLIENGDVEEIREALEAFSKNEIQVLLGIKSDKYQTVYNNVTLRPYATDPSKITKALDNYVPADVYFPKVPYKLAKYGGTSPDPENTDEPTDDLPFDNEETASDVDWSAGVS